MVRIVLMVRVKTDVGADGAGEDRCWYGWYG